LFVLLLDHMEDKLVGVADIEQRLRLKALVVFPHLRRKQRNQVALIMHDSPFSQYAESMAGLRNLLDSPRYHGLTKAILSMSTQPGEGKTCTSTNLAIAYAQSGQRTLLVDFDMRRPRLAGIFGRSPDSFPSLPHTLAKNDASLFDALPQDTQVPNLQIVYSRASGSISPSVLMGTNIITDFFAWARKNYDHIIIDSPPFGLVGDVIVLANLVDSVLLVATPDKTRFGPIQFATRRLTEVGAKILGVVVNNVDFGRWGGFGNYSSRYGYSTSTYIPREARDLSGAKAEKAPKRRHGADAPAAKAEPPAEPPALSPDDQPVDDALASDDD
ncbi:MAG TPA: CpsD/CapB family tyrosine-protein kinase, partial [Candidatus Spyradenecus faecavium]|nr:CpsD/CapB family tyrosine-protein kinase [Candidatus Spyradenecus faecavium]